MDRGFWPKRPNQQIAQRLRERRLMLGPKVSLRTIAAAIGQQSHTNLVRYESGNVVNYDAEVLRRLARVYGCSVQDFYKPPGSPWTEHKLPLRRTTAPLRIHPPTKHLDIDACFPITLPPLTKTMAEVRALKKWMRGRNDLSLSFGANDLGLSAVLKEVASGSMVMGMVMHGAKA